MTTEKTRIDFMKWYFDKYVKTTIKYENLLQHQHDEIYKWFFNLDKAFKYGVYVLFFDSVDISVASYRKWHVNKRYYETAVNGYLGAWETLEEAQEEALKEADRIYNNNDF